MEKDIWSVIIQEAKCLEIQEPELTDFLRNTISMQMQKKRPRGRENREKENENFIPL